MGNQQSSTEHLKTNEKNVMLPEVIDAIATKYILTQNFQDMLKLENKDYCDKLIILTSKIFASHLTNIELAYLAQRTEKGVVIDKMTKDKIAYLDKSKSDQIDVQNPIQKRRMCIGIAKYYVRIAHIFAAITKTLNPTYEYKNAIGETERVSLLNKSSIPANVEKKLVQTNICSKRFNVIKPEINQENGVNVMTINPKFCDMNKTTNDKKRSLADEPGIPELRELYNDVYDYNIGKYVGMSPQASEKYKNDLKMFYTAFTGTKEMPPEITSFSNIPLIEFHKSIYCMDSTNVTNTNDVNKYGLFNKKIKGNADDKLFQEYGKHMASMLTTSQTNQAKLLNIIDKLFIFRINPKTKEKEISIHPELSEDVLNQITEETRNTIISLYIKCEQDFQKGLVLFETIINEQMRQTAQRRVDELEKQRNDALTKINEIPIPKITPNN